MFSSFIGTHGPSRSHSKTVLFWPRTKSNRSRTVTLPSACLGIIKTSPFYQKLLDFLYISPILILVVPLLTITAGWMHLISSRVIFLSWSHVLLSQCSPHNNRDIDHKDHGSDDTVRHWRVIWDPRVSHRPTLPHSHAAIDDSDNDHDAAQPLMANTHAAPGARVTEMQMLE